MNLTRNGIAFLFTLACGVVDAGESGTLATSSGSSVQDWQLAMLIDQAFQDGNPGDGVVTSQMSLFFTQCYGGDMIKFFDDGPPAEILDSVRFPNASVMSAAEAGLPAYYGGAHVGASETLRPGATATDVATAALKSRDAREWPQYKGRDRRVDGASSTHLLIWAGDPNDRDFKDIENIHGAFDGRRNTTVSVLSGDGTAGNGGPFADGPATAERLKEELASIGQLMDDGPDERFILFVTDHGGRVVTEDEPRTVPPETTDSSAISLGDDTVEAVLDDPDNETVIEVGTTGALSAEQEAQTEVYVNDQFVGTLADAETFVVNSTLVADKYLLDYDIEADLSLDPDAPILVEIDNQGDEPVDVTYTGINTGQIDRLPANPPQGTYALLDFLVLFDPSFHELAALIKAAFDQGDLTHVGVSAPTPPPGPGIDVTGDDPFVDFTIDTTRLMPAPAGVHFAGSGSGLVAGIPSVSIEAAGTFDGAGNLDFEYTICAGGECPGGLPATYGVTARPLAPATTTVELLPNGSYELSFGNLAPSTDYLLDSGGCLADAGPFTTDSLGTLTIADNPPVAPASPTFFAYQAFEEATGLSPQGASGLAMPNALFSGDFETLLPLVTPQLFGTCDDD
ncbi:MAG: hypothetical protein AAGE01_13480 [Pseudomonadota bacterium]